MTTCSFPQVRSTLAAAAAAHGTGLLELELDSNALLDTQQLLGSYKQAIRRGGRRIKLAVIDHVISFPPVVLPVKELCDMFR